MARASHGRQLLARRLHSGRCPSNRECQSCELPLPCGNSRSHALEAFCLDRAEKLLPSEGLLLSLPAHRARIRARHACEPYIHGLFRKQSERSMLVLSGVRYYITVLHISSVSHREVAFALSVIYALGCHQTNTRVTVRRRLRCPRVFLRRMKA